MSDEGNIPIAYMFRVRMQELLDRARDDGIISSESWDPDVLGFVVYGGDRLLQQFPTLVTDIVGYQLGGAGVTDSDLGAIARGMRDRKSAEEFIGDLGELAQSEGGSNE